VATSNPNKNGFSSPLSWRAQTYEMEMEEEERVVPTSLSSPPSAPNRVARAPKCPRFVFPRENRRKRANLSHQRKLAPSGSLSPPGASEKIVGTTSSYRPAVSRCR